MSRTLKNDFEEIIIFLNSLTLSDLTKSQDYKNQLSAFHKKYFAYLILSIELETVIPPEQHEYIKETSSDLTTCLFHLSTGAYKSARLLLRSSIECFIKGFCMGFDDKINKNKSVVDIFTIVKELPYFSKEPFNKIYNELKNSYKELCKDAHTATKINMANTCSLDFFPKHSNKLAQKFVKISINLISIYCFLLAHYYNIEFHSMHHTDKEIILASIEKKLRPIINDLSLLED